MAECSMLLQSLFSCFRFRAMDCFTPSSRRLLAIPLHHRREAAKEGWQLTCSMRFYGCDRKRHSNWTRNCNFFPPFSLSLTFAKFLISLHFFRNCTDVDHREDANLGRDVSRYKHKNGSGERGIKLNHAHRSATGAADAGERISIPGSKSVASSAACPETAFLSFSRIL